MSRIHTLLIVLATFSACIRDAQGGDSIRAQDLSALSHADRVAAMKAFLERRIDKVQNIDVTSETRRYNRKYSHGSLGDRTADCGWVQFHTLRCDGSYKVTSSWFVNQAATVADSTDVSHHDEKTGITRVFCESVGRKQGPTGLEHVRSKEGRIGLDHMPTMESNRVAFHLLAGSYVIKPFCDKGEFLLQSLASCSENWDVEVNVQQQQVTISHPYRMAFMDTGTGVRKVYFDVRRGMLPVRIDVDYRGEVVTSLEPRRVTPIWREERIVMDEPRNFDGLWMATRIEERLRASPLGPQVCCIILTRVKEIVFDKVKQDDLPVTFPPDTEVADTVKNVFYRTGPDGEPTEPINPIGIPKTPISLDAQGRLIQEPSWMLRVGIWLIGIAIALLVCVIILKRRLARASP
jgi:hypothetical protein